jgi:Zn-dependent M28 family amino/carboxypeptidase
LSFDEAQQAADENQPMSKALGVDVTIVSVSKHERISSPNVIGILPGSDPELKDEYIVYSTHLDHLGTGAPVDGDNIYNGFYDNAFGVAVSIEVARALKSLSVSPRRSIIFVAVTGEERGLLGSDYFAHYPTVPSSSLVANVNIDMPMMLFPLNTIVGYGSEHSSLEELTATEAIKEGFEATPDPYPDEVYFIRSDQYSFVRQGIPAVYFAEGIGSSDPTIDGRAVQMDFEKNHYHKPSDDLSQPVDWETTLRFSRAGARIGYRIAMNDERPEWNEGDFFGEKFGRK